MECSAKMTKLGNPSETTKAILKSTILQAHIPAITQLIGRCDILTKETTRLAYHTSSVSQQRGLYLDLAEESYLYPGTLIMDV